MNKLEEILILLGLDVEKVSKEDLLVIEKLVLEFNKKVESLESYIYNQEQDDKKVELAVKNMASFIEEES